MFYLCCCTQWLMAMYTVFITQTIKLHKSQNISILLGFQSCIMISLVVQVILLWGLDNLPYLPQNRTYSCIRCTPTFNVIIKKKKKIVMSLFPTAASCLQSDTLLVCNKGVISSTKTLPFVWRVTPWIYLYYIIFTGISIALYPYHRQLLIQ